MIQDQQHPVSFRDCMWI